MALTTSDCVPVVQRAGAAGGNPNLMRLYVGSNVTVWPAPPEQYSLAPMPMAKTRAVPAVSRRRSFVVRMPVHSIQGQSRSQGWRSRGARLRAGRSP